MSRETPKYDTNSRLHEQWIQVLRARRGAAAALLPCPYCYDPPNFSDEPDLWLHVKTYHAVHMPKNDKTSIRDDTAVKRFREEVLAKSRATPKKAKQPENERLPKDGDIKTEAAMAVPRTPGILATALTASHLEDLHNADVAGTSAASAAKRLPAMSNAFETEEQAYKKQAIGMGKAPSSSHSQGSAPHSQTLPASRRPGSPLTNAKGQDSMEFASRGPSTPGKRLFDPSDATSPQSLNAANVSSSGGNASTRPVQQIRKRLSYPQYVASTHTEKPASFAYARGTLPAEVLTAGKPQGNQQSSPTSDHSKIISQPETRPISQEQLVAEVKGIYAGLVMVEGKCIQVDLKQAQLAKEAPLGIPPKLNNEQYQALIALHRTLLQEHHDFFLASQHPSATPAVRRLAVKYAMPARLWRHGIHSFLELLRNRLPASLDYMLQFIYLAYSMMTLLLETVPAFEDTWIECLGDLGRYRMAIEDDNVRDREIWAQVARQWYLKSANRSPTTGRLYHHLAILARPDALPQLLYYGKSLAVPIPFTAARESIMTLFEPTLNPSPGKRRFSAVITAVVRCHAIVFTGQSLDTFDETLGEITSHLDGHIARITKKYLEQGYYIAISNCIALLGYGANDNPLSILMNPLPSGQDTIMPDAGAEAIPELPATFAAALRLFNQTTKIHLLRIGDTNTLSFLHVTLVFLRHVARHPRAVDLLFPTFPWKQLVRALNAIIVLHPPNRATIESPKLPRPDSPPPPVARVETTPDAPPPPTSPLNTEKLDIAGKHDTVAPALDIFRPFPEEWAMQGLPWTSDYHPEGWFANENVEPESHYLEAESMRSQHRPERVLWLGVQLSRLGGGDWLGYGAGAHTFSVGPKGVECQADEEESESDSEIGAERDSERDDRSASLSSSESGTLEIDNEEDSELKERLSFLDRRDPIDAGGGGGGREVAMKDLGGEMK